MIKENQENVFIVERCEILGILGVSEGGLKTIIKRKQLETRLKEKGYLLLETFKKGRKTLYKIEEVSIDKFKLNTFLENIFNTTKDEDLHTDYIMYRYANIFKPLSKKHLSEKIGVNEKTVGKWDNHMITNKLLAKDGYFYVSMDFKEDGFEYRLTDEYEYKSFYTNNRYIKEREKAFDDYDNKEITRERFDMVITASTECIKANYGKIVYKISLVNMFHISY